MLPSLFRLLPWLLACFAGCLVHAALASGWYWSVLCLNRRRGDWNTVMDALWQHATLQQGPSLTIHERSHLSRSGVGHRKRRDDSGDAWMGALRRLFRLGGWGQRCFLRSRSMCSAAYYCIHVDLGPGGPGRAPLSIFGRSWWCGILSTVNAKIGIELYAACGDSKSQGIGLHGVAHLVLIMQDNIHGNEHIIGHRKRWN